MTKNNDLKNAVPTQQDTNLQAKQNVDAPSRQTQVFDLSSEDVGMRLKALRTFHHYSQQDIADALGVQRQTVTGWEASKSLPSPRYIAKLRDIYHISAEQLLDLSIPAEELFLSLEVEHETDSAQEEWELEKKQEKELLSKWFVMFSYVLLATVILLATTYPPIGLITCIGYFFSRKRLGIQNRILDVITTICLLFNCYGVYIILNELFFHFGHGEATLIESLLNFPEVYHASL